MYGNLCTEFYDADKSFASPEELQLYQDLFKKKDILLEPMCGSGRLLIPLMQMGYTIHGLDNSTSMLASCRQRSLSLNLEPELIEDTLENHTFDTCYHGIIVPLGSFQLLYPRQKAHLALQQFKKLLLPNGKLVIDIFVPWEALYEHGEINNSTRQVQLHTGEAIVLTSKTEANKYDQHILSKTHYIKSYQDKVIAEEDEQMNVLWYYQFEMTLMLEKHGFSNIQCVNRFINGSDHMTFIATA